MHLHTSHITHNLEHEAAHHRAGETRCFVPPELKSLDAENEAEDGEEEGVAAEAGVVIDWCFGEGTGTEGASHVVVYLRHFD